MTRERVGANAFQSGSHPIGVRHRPGFRSQAIRVLYVDRNCSAMPITGCEMPGSYLLKYSQIVHAPLGIQTDRDILLQAADLV
jgi:hypothetical protein